MKKDLKIDKWNYDNISTQITLLEIKMKRIFLTKRYLNLIKPSFLYLNKRKNWHLKVKEILTEEEQVTIKLQIAYAELEKILQEEN